MLSSVMEEGDHEYDSGLKYDGYTSRNASKKRLPQPPAGIRTASQMNLLNLWWFKCDISNRENHAYVYFFTNSSIYADFFNYAYV